MNLLKKFIETIAISVQTKIAIGDISRNIDKNELKIQLERMIPNELIVFNNLQKKSEKLSLKGIHRDRLIKLIIEKCKNKVWVDARGMKKMNYNIFFKNTYERYTLN